MMRRMMGMVGALVIGSFAGCGGDKTPVNVPAEAKTILPAAPVKETPATPAKPKVSALPVLDADGLAESVRASGAKITLVAMWATWCGPCIEEMPHLSAFQKKHAADGLRVVGLCTDDREELGERIQEILDEQAPAYAQALLSPGGEEALMTSLGETWNGQLPKTLVLGPDGKKLHVFNSAITEADLAAKVGPLLGAAAPSKP